MTRFNITLEQGVNLVLQVIQDSWGGEIFVPKIPSYKITDLAEAIGPNCKKEIIGIRPGEKLHEEMITEMDALKTVEFDKYYVILPSAIWWKEEEYIKNYNGKRVSFGFKYSSDTNLEWLSVDQIRKLIVEYVDPHFSVQ